ncbi:hypothetical protein ACC676_39765, partial [Rhizobium ruizarguesonis]
SKSAATAARMKWPTASERTFGSIFAVDGMALSNISHLMSSFIEVHMPNLAINIRFRFSKTAFHL